MSTRLVARSAQRVRKRTHVLVPKVYGRFMLRQQERDKWEKAAHLRDENRANCRGIVYSFLYTTQKTHEPTTHK